MSAKTERYLRLQAVTSLASFILDRGILPQDMLHGFTDPLRALIIAEAIADSPASPFRMDGITPEEAERERINIGTEFVAANCFDKG